MRKTLVLEGQQRVLERLLASGEPPTMARDHLQRLLAPERPSRLVGAAPTVEERVAAYERAVSDYRAAGMSLPQANRAAYAEAGRWRGPRLRCRPPGERCLACGAEGRLTPDHVIPIANGGWDAPANLQTLCWECNTAKGLKETDYREVEEPAEIGPKRRGR